MSFIGLFYPWGVILQAVALLHFARRRPDTYWVWIILMGGGIGAFVYIVAEVLPDASLVAGSFESFSRRRRIRELQHVVLDNPAVGNQEELADLYLEEGQVAKAKALYDTVIAASRTTSLDAFYRRGIAELTLGDDQAARADLERVVAQDPKHDFHRAIGLLAHACGRTGDAAKADELFKRATDISTMSETSYNYACFLADQKRPAEAKEWAERILAKKRTMPRYLVRRERPWFRKANALLKRLKSQPA